MTYEETLEKIDGYSAFGKQPGLERITELMRILGDPQDSLRIIHVAGTNGKGSVCRYLYSVLEAAGFRCGLYTSPYIEKFTERIQFHGIQIPEEDLIRIGERVFGAAADMVERGFEEPTSFDVITAIAFVYFAEVKADFVVLEVGLGGRFDSTNVIKHPLATVITSISKDHTAVLGDTLEQIAREKAGIIKPGVPVVYAVKDKAAAKVICDEAQSVEPQAAMFDVLGTSHTLGKADVWAWTKKLGGSCFSARICVYQYDTIELSMTGDHQVENALCALTVLELLRRKGHLGEDQRERWLETVRRGMKAAKQPGRFELISEDPLVILDGGHNQDGVRSLVAALTEHFAGKKLLVVFGILKDKAVGAVLEELKPLVSAADVEFLATEPDSPRRMDAAELAANMETALGAACRSEADWKAAVAMAESEAQKYDAVIFGGSLYLIGSVRTALSK